jgi:GTPase SAR1 family protein
VEGYCATYNPDVFVVVYSVVDRKSLKVAEDILLFLWKGDYVASRGVILAGNKADLERKREVTTSGNLFECQQNSSCTRWIIITNY